MSAKAAALKASSEDEDGTAGRYERAAPGGPANSARLG